MKEVLVWAGYTVDGNKDVAEVAIRHQHADRRWAQAFWNQGWCYQGMTRKDFWK